MKANRVGVHLAIIYGALLALLNAQYYGTFGRGHFLIRSSPVPLHPISYETFRHSYTPIQTESRIGSPFSSQVNTELQQTIRQVAAQISRGSETFSIDMFRSIAHAVRNYDANFVVAPFSVWSLMLLVAEGAAGQTYDQLQKVLRMPNDLYSLRAAYRRFQNLLLVNTTTVELAVNQALFSDKNRPIEFSYANILLNEYEADHLPVDFNNSNVAVKSINDHINLRTHGKIKDIVKPDDLIDTQLILTSAIFFKGQWKFPFNVNNTKMQPFFRENGDFVANVPMMSQRQIFPFTTINALDASILELPYGREDRLCMLLILPRRNATLATVFENLQNFDIEKINHEIHKYDNTNDYDETEVDLTLPKFNINSDLELRTVLEDLGITDVFDPAKANLSKMSKQNTFVSRVFHKAVIEVNEVGTVAAAVSAGTVSFKQTPVEFVFNRPFGFLITDKITKTLLFAGQVRHPLIG